MTTMSACSKCGVEMGHASGLGSPCVTCRIESGDWDPAPVDAFRATSPGLCPDPIPDDVQEELTQLRAQINERNDTIRLLEDRQSETLKKVWQALGISTYEQAKPFSVFEHIERLRARVKELEEIQINLKAGYARSHMEICQSLGRALRYPRFCDDQKNFPGATDADGVCVGEHVAESIADEAANKITQQSNRIRELEEAMPDVKGLKEIMDRVSFFSDNTPATLQAIIDRIEKVMRKEGNG